MRKMILILFAILFIPILVSCSSSTQSQLYKEVSERDYNEVLEKVETKTFRAQLLDGRAWVELSISDKGEVFGFTPFNNNTPGEIIIYDLNTDTYQSIYLLKDETLPTFFKHNENYLLWTETKNRYNDAASKIVLYDRRNKETVTLSEDNERLPSLTYEMIALGNEFVLWSTSEIIEGNVKNNIMRYDLETRVTSLFKEDAIMPIIGNDFIAWLGPKDEKMEHSAIFFHDSKENSTNKIITEGQNPRYINTDGKSIVFNGISEQDSNLKFLSIYENGSIKIINQSYNDYFDFPEISDNYIGWRGTDKLRFYSRNTSDIGILSEEFADYSEIKVSNKYIMWHSPAITDEYEAKLKAMEQRIYFSDLHIAYKND